MIKTSNTGYVTLKVPDSIFSVAYKLGVATGQKRNNPNGTVEAEFLCIRPGDNCEKIWATREQIIPNP